MKTPHAKVTDRRKLTTVAVWPNSSRTRGAADVALAQKCQVSVCLRLSLADLLSAVPQHRLGSEGAGPGVSAASVVVSARRGRGPGVTFRARRSPSRPSRV